MASERGGIYELNDLERTLGRIVLGYRGVVVTWVVLLVLVAGTGDAADFDRPWVPWTEVGVIVLWFAFTVWLWGRKGDALTSWWFLALDVSVAVGVLLASWIAGGQNIPLAGGYPLSAVAMAVFAVGGPGALISAGFLLGAALVRRVVLLSDSSLAGLISDVASWVFPAVLFAWATGVIRTSDRRRQRSEHALADERSERVRIEERAEVAAHLHDSVLQTLALIQRSSSDSDEVTTLARRQERELRSWLFGAETLGLGGSLVSALRSVADGVEEKAKVKVELVSVGDVSMSEAVESLTRAAREAVSNAAQHGGVDVVDVYSEVDDERIVVFVRDRGAGFDPLDIPPDRAGVRESIVGRMQRSGGSAVIKSSPERGTEVILTLPVASEEVAIK